LEKHDKGGGASVQESRKKREVTEFRDNFWNELKGEVGKSKNAVVAIHGGVLRKDTKRREGTELPVKPRKKRPVRRLEPK